MKMTLKKWIYGPIGWFLSLDMWAIPARLSYAMYLIHYPIMFSILGSQKSPMRFSDSYMLFRFLSDLCLTILAALLLNVVVEAPFAELCNLLFAKLSGAKKDYQNKASKDKHESPPSLEEGKEKQDESPTSVEVVNEKGVLNPVVYTQFNNADLVPTTNMDLKREKHRRS